MPWSWAVCGEPAAVLLEDRAADGETQSQAAKAAGGGDTPLLHDVEDAWQDRRVDADAGVDHLDHQVASIRGAFIPVSIERTDGDLSSGGRELDRVLDQVPESLLESDRIDVEVVPPRGQVDSEPETGVREIGAADLDDLVDKMVGIGELALEEQRSGPDS